MRERHLYWNANNFAVVIVALEGGCNDWAAYIGATDSFSFPEYETVEFVKKHGCKISKDHAEFLFPEFKDLEWRP